MAVTEDFVHQVERAAKEAASVEALVEVSTLPVGRVAAAVAPAATGLEAEASTHQEELAEEAAVTAAKGSAAATVAQAAAARAAEEEEAPEDPEAARKRYSL